MEPSSLIYYFEVRVSKNNHLVMEENDNKEIGRE